VSNKFTSSELKALEQFFLDDDEIEYTLKDAKEAYRP